MTENDTGFLGFPYLDANYVWCPNQFLDRCIVCHDRGVVRLVGYVIYQTLRLLDQDGVPVKQNIAVSFNKIVREAGISRGAAGKTIKLAIQNGFLTCVAKPSAKKRNSAGQVGTYSMRWNEVLSKHDDSFAGFYSGDGHRTQIPHAFFTNVVPSETLGTIRVVAAVIRHTIGYSNQFGGRRSDAPLSYDKLQTYTGLSRSTLATAIKDAVSKGFILIVEQGTYSTGEVNLASRYSLNWLTTAKDSSVGSKIEPHNESGERSVQKSNWRQFSKETGERSKTEPEDRFKNLPTRKEERKENNKQDDVVDQDHRQSIDLLVKHGVTNAIAKRVAEAVTLQEIERQIHWLPQRNIRSNEAGFLVNACINQYSDPLKTNTNLSVDRRKVFSLRRDVLLEAWKKQRIEDRHRWEQVAYESESDTSIRRSIRFCGATDKEPHKRILDAMAIELELEPLTDPVSRPKTSAQ